MAIHVGPASRKGVTSSVNIRQMAMRMFRAGTWNPVDDVGAHIVLDRNVERICQLMAKCVRTPIDSDSMKIILRVFRA